MAMTRREFIKASAASAAAASIGVDLLLSKALAAAPAPVWHKSVCRFCGVGCGVMLGVEKGKPVALKGDKENTVNSGLLCVKAFYLHKVITAKGRLLYPMIRKNGELQRATWDEAMTMVASKFKEAIDQFGPDAVAYYGSGQATTEETYLANKLFKGHIGTNNLEGNPRLCMASAVGGYLTTFGGDEPIGSYDDIGHCDLFLLVGTNTAEAHPVVYDRIVDRKKKNPQTKVIIIDPRKTPTNKIADLHLQVIPGYDLAVMHAMARIIINEGYADEQFIKESVNFSDGTNPITYDDYKKFLEKYTPEYAAAQAGVKAEDIVQAARLFGQTKTAMSMWTMGVNQRTRGVWLNNLIHNLHLLTGKLGKPGCDSFSLTGQPNACGGVREGGGLSHLLPGHRSVENEQHRKEIAAIWNVPPEKIQSKPGKHTMAMFEAVAKGEIKALLVLCTNPAHSLPNLNKYRKGMQDTFLVVADAFHPTETTKLADVVLPVAFWGEKEGVYGCTERRSQHMTKALEPPGEARWDGEVLIDLAKRLGYGANFEHFKTPEDVWTEYIKCTKGTDMDLSGAPYSRLREVHGLRWPVPSVDHPGTTHRFVEGDPLFPKDKAAGRRMYFYKKPDGKAVIFARPDKGPEEPTDAEYPIALTTGRVLEHWHTMTMTGQIPELVRAVPKPYAEINPDDASAWGIADKSNVRIVTRRGKLELEARVIDRPRKGTIFIPWHWPEKLANLLTIDAIDPGSKEPEYKVCAAKIEKA
ncbi:MAG: nitrate reductase [candidate division KSB1 bacterium]|nr:nitrate reductase [candidate division KSB1 bacterium]MDZ7304854.1 nitrate reductase [candidate division KSB1 bacterium]MDZ7314107.1 nitrate reductase [candidate division KSB1 bacterium]